MNKTNQYENLKIQEYLEAIHNLEIQHHTDFVGVSYSNITIENMNEYQVKYEKSNDELEEQFENKETEKYNEFEKDGPEEEFEEEFEDEIESEDEFEDEPRYFYYILFDKNLNKNFAFDYFTRKFYVSESK